MFLLAIVRYLDWDKILILFFVFFHFSGPGSCGTVAPVWLDMRTRQNFTENLYSVDACVSWGFGDGGFDNFDCCLFTLPVKVKQCKGFRVYYLGPTQACDIAYCSAPIFKGMAIGVVEFSNRGYEIRKIFA